MRCFSGTKGDYAVNMKVKLLIDNEEIEVDISEEQLEKFKKKPLKKTKTGYERLDNGGLHIRVDGNGNVTAGYADNRSEISNAAYESANYYSDISVAENNARADRLFRQLRRFAVEHRENELDWTNSDVDKFYICYDYNNDAVDVESIWTERDFGSIYFDSVASAWLAIETFCDELIWYFTEYKDSL